MKLIEILGTLKPALIPAIRDAYSEMVAEGIMMKKRMKGYFQALPGKNSAYLNLSAKDLKDYNPFGDLEGEKLVHAPDVSNALNELLPIVSSVGVLLGNTQEKDSPRCLFWTTDCSRGLLHGSLVWPHQQLDRWPRQEAKLRGRQTCC
jgi:hypothetical protein